MSEFLSPRQAISRYDLGSTSVTPRSEIEQCLMRDGIGRIVMPLTSQDFNTLSSGLAACISECPDFLRQTFTEADVRYGGDAGYVRKEKKVDERTGLQTADPKHYFHFTENVRYDWREQFTDGPQELRSFLEDGIEIHDALIGSAKKIVSELESSHRNMSRLYFPNNQSFSFMRLLRYDGYVAYGDMGEVAKPHYDIGGLTIQAYADAPGFWAAKDGVHGEQQYYDTEERSAFTFLGKGHEKVYGPADTLRPLWHGVDRVVAKDTPIVPERTAVILFLDAPEVDYQIHATDTLPHLVA